jgi:hypothetical protein
MLLDKPLLLTKDQIVKQDRLRVRQNSSLLSVFRGKPFWIWDSAEHQAAFERTGGLCCFNHIIGLPEKEHLVGKEEIGEGQVRYLTETRTHPLYDFQKQIIESLENYRYVFLLKSTGLGATELLLRYICWLALKDDRYAGKQAVIVTGPAQELAVKFIARVERFFDNEVRAGKSLKPLAYQPRAVGEYIVINGVLIQAYPSHNFKRARGLDKAFFFLVDEFDFFPPSNQRDARTIPERYIGKSSPFIALVTTPDVPDSLADQLRKENELTCRYKRLYMNYEVGLGKIYTPFEIEEAKLTGDFEREYNLSFVSGKGNIYSKDLLDAIIETYPLEIRDGKIVITVDPAYGSSKFAILIIEQIGGILYVKEAIQFDRPEPSAMVEKLIAYYELYGTRAQVLVDSARPEIRDGLIRRGYPATAVEFNKQRSSMTLKAVQAVRARRVRIHPQFKDLLGQLRAVVYDEKGYPDKKKLNYDLGDAFEMNVAQFSAGDVRFIDLGK